MPKVTKIPQVRFNLKTGRTKNDARLILAVYRFHGKKLVYSTQHKIRPGMWDKQRQWPRNTHTLYAEYKKDLEEIEKAILEYYKGLSDVKRKSLSIQTFRQHLDQKLNRTSNKAATHTFFGYIEHFIERKKRRSDTAKSTIEKYEATYAHLKNYAIHIGEAIDFQDITWAFKDDFIQYCYEHTKAKSQNTVSRYIKVIKLLIKESFREDLHRNEIFRDRDWSLKPKKYKRVALTESEVEKIEKHDFSKSPRLDKAKDLFLLSVYSGLRYSDFTNIKKENVIELEEERFLNVHTRKTGEEVYIPLIPKLESILNKYDYQSPPKISSQRFNEYIKEVCEKAKIDDAILHQYNEGGRDLEIVVKKFDLITAHTGRRTWATINYSKGYPVALLRQVTGHKSEAQFLEYVGAKKRELALSLIRKMRVVELSKETSEVIEI